MKQISYCDISQIQPFAKKRRQEFPDSLSDMDQWRLPMAPANGAFVCGRPNFSTVNMLKAHVHPRCIARPVLQ